MKDRLSKYNTVYVVCTGNVVTGGPDALHQMVYYLNKNAINSIIAYCSKDNKIEIPDNYRIYVKEFIKYEEIEDLETNAIIFPEIYLNKSVKFKKAKKYIWWLGLENGKKFLLPHVVAYTIKMPIYLFTRFKLNIGEAIKELRKRWKRVFDLNQNVTYLCASKHAFDYIRKKTNKDVFYCIEPISLSFLTKYKLSTIIINNRKNVVLYNASKMNDFTRRLIDNNKDITFIPLKGYTQDELIELYKSSKLYIDFGPFSGAERIPKEAVLFGCNILTGRHGASGNQIDVDIPIKYKLEENKLGCKRVGTIIRNMLSNYENIYHDFDSYRNRVLDLELEFEKSIVGLFK